MATDPERLELFAQSLGADDQVTLEAVGNALAIARIIEPHVGRVVLADPRAVRGSASSALKTDKSAWPATPPRSMKCSA